MITVRISGGLGNQLFQYAAARRLALKHRTPLRLELSYYGSYWTRAVEPHFPFALSPFALADPIIPQGMTLAMLQAGRVAARVLRKLPLPTPSHFYFAPHSGFDPRVLDLPDGMFLTGHFQSEKYFTDIAPVLRREFRLKDSAKQAAIEAHVADLRGSRPLVSLHVRRRGFLTPQREGKLVPREKITEAMAHFPQCGFLVFSDDPDWCRENLSAPNIRFSPFQTNIEDLIAMAACDHHVLANSTFSWWAAWLNPKESKRVVAPARWSHHAREDTGGRRDMLPASWIRI